MTKKEAIVVWVLAILLFFEFFILLLLIYFASLPVFLPLFVRTLQLLSPIFLFAYLVFLILALLIKERRLIVEPWQVHFKDSLRFFALSFLIALAMMIVSAVCGASMVFLLKLIYSLPKTHGILDPLKKWVDLMFY
jgi:hypothetical protein